MARCAPWSSRRGAPVRMLKVLEATRYVLPLREGGSLPAVVDTEGAGLFVTKFRGAGQGARALVAEIIVGQLAEALGLAVPELALVALDESFGRSEGDPEIQDILEGSRGLNVGLRYLEGAFTFDVAADRMEPVEASRTVWLDALVSNVDRTARNPNLMVWGDRIWLIDHGSALYFHHTWDRVDRERSRAPFAAVRDHVLLAQATELAAVDEELRAALETTVLEEALAAVPDQLLMDAPAGVTPPFASAEENRQAYRRYFDDRLESPRLFLKAAVEAHQAALHSPTVRKGYRR